MSVEIRYGTIVEWPGMRTPASQRRHAAFKATYSASLDLLDKELEHLGASEVVLQVDVPRKEIRADGLLRSSITPTTPGVVLNFNTKKHGSLTYPCDQFVNWQHNLRAIALSLEALRSVDRYGVTRRGQQYRGWLTLPNLFDPAEYIARGTPFTPESLRMSSVLRRKAYRIRAQELHPDRPTGSDEEMAKLNFAMEQFAEEAQSA